MLQTQNLPLDLDFGFNLRVPPPPLYQDVWNLNCVPLPFDSDQAGAPAPIREHGQSPAQQSTQNTSTSKLQLPGINPLPDFNKYIPPEAYRHTLPPAPKIPKFGTPLLPKEPYIEPQYNVKEELHTQSIADILFPESRFLWNREAQKPIPKVSDFEASLSPRQPHDGANESLDMDDSMFPEFGSMQDTGAQEPVPAKVPELGAPPSLRQPHEQPQANSTNGSPTQNIEEPEQPTSSGSKKEQYQCSNCKKFTKKIVGKKTKKPKENWICRICYFKDYNKKRPRRYPASSK
ncbi:unnamed protein product [Caenorhabditis brenneri]